VKKGAGDPTPGKVNPNSDPQEESPDEEMMESTQFEKSEGSKEGVAEKDPAAAKGQPPKQHSGKDTGKKPSKKPFSKKMHGK
jgi:hypothetical protein